MSRDNTAAIKLQLLRFVITTIWNYVCVAFKEDILRTPQPAQAYMDILKCVDTSIDCFQSRFFVKNENSSRDTSMWWVPLTYTTESERNFKRTKPSYWLRAEKEIVIKDIAVNASEWILFNVQDTGERRRNCIWPAF